MIVCSNPPGTTRTQRSIAMNMPAAMPEFSSSSPVRMNSGTAMSEKLVDPLHSISPTTGITGKNEKDWSSTNVTIDSTAATGTCASM